MDKAQFMKRCDTAWESSQMYWKLNEDIFMFMYNATEIQVRKLLKQKNHEESLQEHVNMFSKQEMCIWNDFAAFLAHPCDKCANDKNTRPWRWGRCNHKKDKGETWF